MPRDDYNRANRKKRGEEILRQRATERGQTEGERREQFMTDRKFSAEKLLASANFFREDETWRVCWTDDGLGLNRNYLCSPEMGLGFTFRRGRNSSLKVVDGQIYANAELFLEKCVRYRAEGAMQKAHELSIHVSEPGQGEGPDAGSMIRGGL